MSTEQFFSLTPDRVLRAVESLGVVCTGLCRALNSLENRVYDVELEDRSRVVAKFYRPGRWSKETVLEEHGFLKELAEAEVPVCAPLTFRDAETLSVVEDTGILVAVFPKVGGRAPEEFTDEQLLRLGTLLARIHQVGAARSALHRRKLTPETYGDESLASLESLEVIPRELRAEFRGVTMSFLDAIRPEFARVKSHRVHGDCHPGNLLWGREGAFFLDFDDMVTAPAVQDLWMIVPGRDSEAQRQRLVLLEGYETFRDFDRSTLGLIEALRGLRYLHYAAWVARRWSDPAFPAAFPHVGGRDYWSGLTRDLREQCELVGATVGAPGLAPEAPSPGVTVREISFRDEDFQRVLVVRSEVFLEELGLDPGWDADGRDPGSLHLLALSSGGKSLGVARLTLRDGSPFVTLSRLSVLDLERRKGVGRALVEYSVEWARERGAKELRTEARREAIPFFAALGFVVEGPGFTAGAMTLRPLSLTW